MSKSAATANATKVAVPQIDNEIVGTLIQMLKLKNHRICLHSFQVANYAVSIAAQMRLPKEEIERIRMAAVLHDVGQLSVPNSIIAKVPYLSAREMSLYRGHCNAGAAMLENMDAFSEFIPYIRFHHEQWDGKGYPQGVSGEQIPLSARLMALVGHFEELSCRHPYRPPISPAQAVAQISAASGTRFDPMVVLAFVEATAEFLYIAETLADDAAAVGVRQHVDYHEGVGVVEHVHGVPL